MEIFHHFSFSSSALSCRWRCIFCMLSVLDRLPNSKMSSAKEKTKRRSPKTTSRKTVVVAKSAEAAKSAGKTKARADAIKAYEAYEKSGEFDDTYSGPMNEYEPVHPDMIVCCCTCGDRCAGCDCGACYFMYHDRPKDHPSR